MPLASSRKTLGSVKRSLLTGRETIGHQTMYTLHTVKAKRSDVTLDDSYHYSLVSILTRQHFLNLRPLPHIHGSFRPGNFWPDTGPNDFTCTSSTSNLGSGFQI